jgi:hypothetical protein
MVDLCGVRVGLMGNNCPALACLNALLRDGRRNPVKIAHGTSRAEERSYGVGSKSSSEIILCSSLSGPRSFAPKAFACLASEVLASQFIQYLEWVS